MRILLLEDHPLNVELFRAILEREGHEVAHEASGLLGRARALAEPFDLILSDIDLPGLDGHSVCRDLRAGGVTCPIVAITAFAGPDEAERGKASGFSLYLTKPIGPQALRRAIDLFRSPADAG
jgi:CheY-like chemotaxis protein